MENKREEQNMSEEFKDIDKPNYKNKLIISGVLYFFVIILSILLVIGLKSQKSTIIRENNKEKSESVENNTKKETIEDKKEKFEKQIEKNADNDYNEELNILNNMG